MACRAGLLTRSLTRIPRAARRRGPCVRPHVLSLPCLPLPRFAVAFTESMKVAAGLQWVRVCVRCAPVSAVAGTWRGLGPERLLRGDRQRPHAHRRSRPVSGSAPHAARGGGVRSCCCSRNSASVWWFWRGTRSAGAASSHAPLRSDERVGRGGGGRCLLEGSCGRGVCVPSQLGVYLKRFKAARSLRCCELMPVQPLLVTAAAEGQTRPEGHALRCPEQEALPPGVGEGGMQPGVHVPRPGPRAGPFASASRVTRVIPAAKFPRPNTCFVESRLDS